MDKTEIALYEYWFVIKRHLRLVVAVFLGTFLITAFFALRAPNIYQADTTFYYPISDKGGSIGSVAQGVLGKEGAGLASSLIPSGGSDLQNYTKGILGSRRIAEILDEDLHLEKRLGLKNQGDAVGVIRGSTNIKLSPEGIMQISVQTTDPKLSADIANGYVDAFRQFSMNSTVSLAQKHRMDVQQRINQLQDKLRVAEDDMMSFQLKHKTADFTQQQKLLMQSLSDLIHEKFVEQVALQATRESLARVTSLSGEQLRAVSRNPLVSPSFTDPILSGLRDQMANDYVKYAQAKLTETPANPELKAYKAELNNVESVMRGQLRRVLIAQSRGVSDDLLNYQVRIAQLLAKQNAVSAGIKKMEDEFTSYPKVGAEYLRLERRLKLLETLDTYLASEYEKAKLEEAKESPDFEVLDKAIPPDFKVGPHRLYNLAVGFLLGILLGIAAAFSVESVKPHLRLVVEKNGHVAAVEEIGVAEPVGKK